MHDGGDGIDGVIFVVEQVRRNLGGGLGQVHCGGLGKLLLYVVHGHHTRTQRGHSPSKSKRMFEHNLQMAFPDAKD